MTENLDRIQPEDPNTVNTSQSWEVEYWCDTLNCTKDQLIKAVKMVGNSVDKIKKYLKRGL